MNHAILPFHGPSRRQLLASLAILSVAGNLAGCGPSRQKLAAFWALQLPAVGPGASGREVALATFQGHRLLVNFWATWCPPCVAEMPMLSHFYAGRGAQDWQCLGLAVSDTRERVEQFLARAPVAYPVAFGGEDGMEISHDLGNQTAGMPGGGLPFTVLFNAKGYITHSKIGQLELSDLEEWLG